MLIPPTSADDPVVLRVGTHRPIEALDVTEMVADNFPGGRLVSLFAPHTTVALVICEADAEMLHDLERTAASLLAPLEPFSHARNGNPNASAHLLSAMMGTHLLLPSAGDALRLGRWQRLILLELDGPKERELHLSKVR